jgi:hypothetical protein
MDLEWTYPVSVIIIILIIHIYYSMQGCLDFNLTSNCIDCFKNHLLFMEF